MGAPSRNMLQIWGGAPETESHELRSAVEDLQADLQALVHDLRRGPVSVNREQIAEYLLELRREFLRHHRRLQVQSRTVEDVRAAQDALRRELAELAGRFRTVALSRSSRVHEGWTPDSLVDAVHTAVEGVPRQLSAAYEPRSLESQPTDGVVRRLQRRWMRLGRWLKKMVRDDSPERLVELRELARYHLEGKAALQVEGLAALFIQAEVQLGGRSRQLLEATAQGFEGLVAHVDQDDFPDMLAGLKMQTEDEFASVEQDVHQILDDSVHRVEMIYGDALQALKSELPIIATVDLPTSQRRSAAVVSESRRAVADLSARLEQLRGTVSAQYVLLALHLEFIGFRARLQQAMDDALAELKADVRGRSRVQLERVLAAVDEVSTELAAGASDDDVRARVQPLEYVVEEASGVTRQLLEQLSDEASVAPLLEALNREAHGLTDRYLVPAARIPRGEWKLPTVGPLTEIEFADVVTDFVQREIAPELLATTHRAMDRVGPILDAFQELERVVSFNAEAIDDQFDAAARDGQQLAEIIRVTLQRSRDTLAERLEELSHWDEELASAVRDIVLEKLDELRRQLRDGVVRRAKVVRSAERAQLLSRVDQVGGAARRLVQGWMTALRRLIGEPRLRAWRRALGLRDTAPEDRTAWVAPQPAGNLPVFYSRLFATRARWAGDVLTVPEAEVRRGHDALLATGPGPKSVALIGVDAATRGALAGAVLRGLKPPRRLAFTHPLSIEQLKGALAEVHAAPVVQISGLSWLISARPGGWMPLHYLLTTMMKEDRRCAWLLEADALVWDFAATVSPLADIFSTQVRLPPLTAAGLEQAILARHQLSGHGLRFSFRGQEETLSEERGPLRERYFQSLFEASGGLLQVALVMWLGSIGRLTDESSMVVVTDAPQSALPALRGCSESTWTALFAVARQGWIDAPALAFTLQVDPVVAEGRLASLVDVGLLERQGREVFILRRHLRGAILHGLREQGWLG